ATAFSNPALHLLLDAGKLVTDKIPAYIFITHTHNDHARMLIDLQSRRVCPWIFTPKPTHDIVNNYIMSLLMLTSNTTDSSHFAKSFEIKDVSPNETYILNKEN